MPISKPRPGDAQSFGDGRTSIAAPAHLRQFSQATPSPRSRCDGAPIIGDMYLGDEVGEQIWKLVRSQVYQKRWLSPLLEDAVQEVESLLQEWGFGPLRNKFARHHFGDPDYLTIKNAIFRAIETALDRLRLRHKVEVKPGSVWFDPTKLKPGRRQRRELPRNEFLGEDDRSVPDGKEHGAGGLDMSLDIGNALNDLCPLGREVVLRKAQLDHTWESIAADLEIPVSRAKLIYKNSIARLTARLKAYYESPVLKVRNPN
jgi:hypothetical protein